MRLCATWPVASVARALDAVLRRTLQASVRWIPPRGRGLQLVSIVDAHVPPTARLYKARVAGRRVACDLRDPVQRCVFYRGIYEPAITGLLDTELGPGDVFLDVGANIGYFSCVAAAKVGVSGRVVAFEPAPDLSRRLLETSREIGRRSRSVRLARIEVHDVALSDREGEAMLSWATNNRYAERFLSVEGGGEAVRTVRLSAYLPELTCDVVKIDVEGAELRVLRGMEAMLVRDRPRLVLVEALEWNLGRFGDSVAGICGFMEGAGYDNELIVADYVAPMLAFRPSPDWAGT